MKTITLSDEEEIFMNEMLKGMLDAHFEKSKTLEAGRMLLDMVKSHSHVHSDQERMQRLMSEAEEMREKAEKSVEQRYRTIISLQSKIMMSATDN